MGSCRECIATAQQQLNNESGYLTLVVVPTAWGRATTNTAGAITAVWNEVKQKAPSANTTQMYWQYACHQQFAPLKASWNLDTWVRRTSYADSIKNLCN